MGLQGVLIWVGLAGGLGACAAQPGPGEFEALLQGATFAPREVAASPEQVFALDGPMRAFLDTDVAGRARTKGQIRGLFEGLRDTVEVGYDTTITRTASETFAARSGNCLSLVLMTGAFAKALRVPVHYQDVFGEETWSRSERLAFRSGHVNILLGKGVLDRDNADQVIIDFLPSPVPGRRNSRTIGEETVVAMYLNNRAAETLNDGDLDAAYAWARAAVRSDPAFNSAYNTLGVIYLRHGDLALAERTLRHALARRPGSAEVLGNLVSVALADGRGADAHALRVQLEKIEPYPPFYFMDQGLAAMNRGDDRAALELFEKELRRMPYDDEVQFAVAVASLKLGDLRDARTHMALALRNSTTQDRHNIYAAKLAHLQQMQPSR